MAGYSTNIERDTLENEDFRRVLFTGKHTQLVLMTLKPGEEIGQEVHDSVDQFFRIEAGTGEAVVVGERTAPRGGKVVVTPPGARQNIINPSATESLRLYTLYSPPNHPDGTVHKTKAEADEYEKHHHG